MPSGFGDLMQKLITGIWKEQATEAGFAPELVQQYGNQLSKAVTKGYGKDFFKTDFTMPDYEKLKALHIDAWKFASAKGNTQMQELSDALRKPDGSLRTFQEFRAQSVLITGKHLNGLKAEYNTAVASAQMASKWVTIQAQKELYPYLQYLAVEDNRTTNICLGLANQVHHVDSPFWDKWYPPNHYNCRSTVMQLRSAPTEPNTGFEEPKVPEIFKTNFAGAGLIMPEDHTYYKGVDKNELFNKIRPYLPYKLQFDAVPEAQGLKGTVQKHFMVDELASDYQRLFNIAINKATSGDKIDLVPTLNPNKYGEIRKIIFYDAKPTRSPDLRINSVLVEEEFSSKSFKPNNIMHTIAEGSEQADCVIVSLSEKIDQHSMFRWANSKFKQHPSLEVVEYEFEGVFTKFERAVKSKSQ